MSSLSRPAATGVVLAVVASLVTLGTTAAVASHFRASGSSFVVDGDAATWAITTAWAVDDGDYVFSDTPGTSLAVSQLGAYGDVPDTGTPTATELALSSYDNDQSNSLFDRSTEVLEGDLASLGDGIYEVYSSSCCRIGGVENTPTEDFSAWARFTKSGSTYDLPPAPSSPTLYALLNTVGDTVIDFRAVDPEGEAVTYTMLTDSTAPYLGADPLPCSTFVGGLLTVGPTRCSGGDVYTDLYLAGTFWAVKIVVSDPVGNQIALDSLLHVLTAPEPYIDYTETVGNGTALDFYVYDDNSEPMDSITVTCVSQTDATDIVSGTSATSPVRVVGFTDGSDYDCSVEATNGAGSGSTAYDFTTGEIVLDGVQIQTDLAVGDNLAGTEVTLVGENLLASSPYELVQHSDPVTLFTGTATGAGAFESPVTLGTQACVAGVHELVLSGVSSSSAVVEDRVWYELDTNCAVLQFSRLGPVTASAAPALAATGAEIGLAAPVAAAALLGGGAVLLLVRRRTRHGV